MIDNSLFTIQMSSNNIPIVLGKQTTLNANIKNLSTNIRLYNLSLKLILPDGLQFESSSIPATSIVIDNEGKTIINWTNIKDLAPLEQDYVFNFTIKTKTNFKDESIIPFGYNFSNINFEAVCDTMPRGELDSGNIIYEASKLLSFKTARYYALIKVPSKVLKGISTKTYITNCKIINNTISSSNVNLSITLEDGIKYIGPISTSGTNSSSFNSPIVEIIKENNKTFTKISFFNVPLTAAGETYINFTCGILEKYNDNTGTIITHGSNISSRIKLEGLDESYDESSVLKAMDIIINKSVSNTLVDVGETFDFYFNYGLSEYYDISSITITDLLPDGLEFIESSISPSSIVSDANLQSKLITYTIGNKPANYEETVTINCKVNSSYNFKYNLSKVVCGDYFYNTINLTGINTSLDTKVTDSSNSYCLTKMPKVHKQLLGLYYRDGSSKSTNILAPNDEVEYSLTYDASYINSVQKDIYIDDFFPLSLNPIDNIIYTLTGYSPDILQPLLISPHGVSFYFGDIPNNSKTTISFKVPVNNMGTLGTNVNLLKMKGINNNNLSYSDRDQLSVVIGKPNLVLSKTASGNNRNAIKSGETYVYTVTVSNTNINLNETDAFSFNLRDTLSNKFTLVPFSISISGTGLTNTYTVNSNEIIVPIAMLAPGEYITLTYSVTINEGIAPGISITSTASIDNPYSQPFNANLTNYQYEDIEKNISTILTTENIILEKSTSTNAIKIGSEISYSLSAKIPKGTTSYNTTLTDTIPNGQTFVKSIPDATNVSDNIVTFFDNINFHATSSEKTINYTLITKIVDATKTIGTITSNQTNKSKLSYKTLNNSGDLKNINSNLNITINHPNMALDLKCKIKNTSSQYNSNVTAKSGDNIEIRLQFINNGNIILQDGIIEIPLDNRYSFISIDNTLKCLASYQQEKNKLIINIEKLNSLEQGEIVFTIKTLSNLRAGTIISTTAYAIQYKNDISDKIYGGEISNTINITFPPNVSLFPFIGDRITDSIGYKVTPIGSVANLVSIFTNDGSGIDDFTLSINKIDISYSVYIDNTKIVEVAENTNLIISADQLKNIPIKGQRTITLVVPIPFDTPSDKIFRFNITVKSNTSPYPEKSIVYIDPFDNIKKRIIHG